MIAEKMKNMVANSSAIRAMFEEGNRLAQIYGAENVFDFSLGNPNVPAPEAVKQAMIEILNEEDPVALHGYTNSNAGYADVRQAVADSLNERFETAFSGNNIVMTVGAAGGLNVALKILLNPGDEVILPEPAFVSYLPCVKLADGVPVTIDLKEENHFKLKPEELLAAITDKTKILILSYPNNPTGAIMTREDLEPIAEIVKEKDLYVISDEIYAELTYGQDHCSIASLPGMRDRTIIINGFSKSFAMTGWRMGFATGPELIMQQILKIHQFAIMAAPTTSQYAAIEAMTNGEEDVQIMRNAYNQRRRFVLELFSEMGLKCFEPEGAFYMFPCIKEFGMTSDEFANRFLREEKVAVIPGTAFGECGEGFLRVSYAYSIEELKEALGRMADFVTRLRQEKDL